LAGIVAHLVGCATQIDRLGAGTHLVSGLGSMGVIAPILLKKDLIFKSKSLSLICKLI
jgi:hypothetical protein